MEYQRLLKTKKFSKIVLQSSQESADAARIQIPDFLELATQRPAVYDDLVKLLWSATDSSHPDFKAFEEIEVLIRKAHAKIGTLCRDEEDIARLYQVDELIVDIRVEAPFRKFVFSSPLKKVSRKAVQLRTFFCFSDVLMYTKQVAGKEYRWKGTIPLGFSWVKNLEDTPKIQHAFMVVGPEKTYTLIAATAEEKKDWVMCLNDCIATLEKANPDLKKKKADVKVAAPSGIGKLLSKHPKDYDPDFGNAASATNKPPPEGTLSPYAQPDEPVQMPKEARVVDKPEPKVIKLPRERPAGPPIVEKKQGRAMRAPIVLQAVTAFKAGAKKDADADGSAGDAGAAPSGEPAAVEEPAHVPQTVSASAPAAPPPPAPLADAPVAPRKLEAERWSGFEDAMVCLYCNKIIQTADFVAVNETSFVHAECFCCAQCKTDLNGLGFVMLKNRVYCEGCYKSFFARRCATCQEPITIDAVNVLGSIWHQECFGCSTCGGSLSPDNYFVSSTYKPICHGCSGTESNSDKHCKGCRGELWGGSAISACGGHFHEACFKCGKCRHVITDGTFLEIDGQPCHTKCPVET